MCLQACGADQRSLLVAEFSGAQAQRIEDDQPAALPGTAIRPTSTTMVCMSMYIAISYWHLCQPAWVLALLLFCYLDLSGAWEELKQGAPSGL